MQNDQFLKLCVLNNGIYVNEVRILASSLLRQPANEDINATLICEVSASQNITCRQYWS